MRSLARAITGLELPAVEKISNEQAEDPFQILIATILSARTQDATTETRTDMADLAVSNVLAFLGGQPPLTPVT